MTSEEFPTKYNVKDPIILDKIVDGYGPRIVGEENNIKLLWLSCISKDLPKKNRLSAIITSQSSAGKSNLINTILEPFYDDVIDYTDYTSAFLNRSEMNMNGKIFKIEQIEKTNDKKQVTISTLKFLLTEGRIRIGLVDKDEKGKNSPKVLEVVGIPVVLTTSTNYNIDPETLNRTLLMQVDETEQQTKRIVSHTFDDYETLSINDTWTQELEELKKLAKAYKRLAHQIRDVVIPFGHKLEKQIPTFDLTIRRDLQKILNLTCVIAFMHASNRIRIVNTDGEHFIIDNFGNTENRYTYAIVAESSDFKEALEIGESTIKQTLNKANKSSMEIYDVFLELYRQKVTDNSLSEQNLTLDDSNSIQVGVTIKEISKTVNLSSNRAREYMNQLYRAGFVNITKNSKREFEYSPTGKKFEKIDIEQIEFTKEELESWLDRQTRKHSDKLEVVYPDDRDVVL